MSAGVVNKSAVKRLTELDVSSEFLKRLEGEVEELVRVAEYRCSENGRKTLLERDV